MKLTRIGAVAAISVLAFSACTPGGAGAKTIKFAIELPMQGSELAAAQPIINGAKLALKQVSNKVGSYTIEIPQSAVYDDALNGVHDPQTGAANMNKIVADDSVVAIIGPLNSSVAKAQIPISSAAGYPQCSPANTNPDLTKGAPAAQLRNGKPNNYVRVVTTDDVQGPAASQYIYETLKKKTVYIIDSTDTFGKGVADAFEADFKKRGGTVTAHDGAPKTTQDYVSIMTAAKAKNPEAIYFGGVTADGGARILLAAAQVGLGDVPFVGPDGINDGSATTANSFLNLAGDKAKNSFSTLAGIGDFPNKAKFLTDYKTEYGQDATGYAAQGFACAQVFIDALGRAAAKNPADNKALREALRGTLIDPSHQYATIQGNFTFDANGDTSQKIVSIYSYDPTAKDWKFETQVDYAAK
jgi:branched-chain amino acid transport system substrate-binding protein